MPIPLCRHIHSAGTRCGSPALTGLDLCFFHQRLHYRHKAYVSRGKLKSSYENGSRLEIGTLEDRTSIQMALSLVVLALSAHDLEVKRGTAILYGLQLASINLPRAGFLTPEPERIVRATLQTTEGLVLAQDESLTHDTPPGSQALPLSS
jgi:hypothetical protein